ncbi:hypothetical protein ACGF5C_15075 [Micromonospora sp. NPDC047620]|uniref:hypothetical protein n=1 Tax=Micromonospora sp. NPDC047620 TaxID=3364251 RepID=UPI0037188F52
MAGGGADRAEPRARRLPAGRPDVVLHAGPVFTLAQARHLIATLRPRVDELIRLRADRRPPCLRRVGGRATPEVGR